MIIAFGEPTHGTLGITKVRIRFFKKLVKARLVHVFVLEENHGICDLVDRYINFKRKTIKKCLEQYLSLNWRSRVFFNFIRWMRKYNLKANKPLRFFGIDCMSCKPYCSKYIGKQYREVSQLRYWSAGANLRDKFMFKNVCRLYKQYGPLFVWAHSGHVNKTPYDKEFKSMGELLKKRYKERYVAISGSFERGNVRVKTSSGTRIVKIVQQSATTIPASGFNEKEVFNLEKNLFDYVYEVREDTPLSWDLMK